jgi:hypothetical protein
MFIKLSYYPNKKTTLVNPFSVKSIYSIYNRVSEENVTKIEFVDGTYVNVYESPDEIYSLQMKQSQFDYTKKTIDEVVKDDYQSKWVGG